MSDRIADAIAAYQASITPESVEVILDAIKTVNMPVLSGLPVSA